jgi:hypothetical protein
MNEFGSSRTKRILCALFVSPGGFLGWAALITLAFCICHVLGWRAHTTFLTGTPSEAGTDLITSAVLGTAYMAAYFGFVLLTPVLLLATAILLGWQHLTAPGTRRKSK